MRHAIVASLAFVFTLVFYGQAAFAQTWTTSNGTPLLRDIVSVDATGEDGWPYGSEDIAGDGNGTFDADEQRLDVRSAYAVADGDQLWVRAYVSSTTTPMQDTALMWVFIDADDNPDTGSGADATDILAEFDADPTSGGYELAVGVQGDGTPQDLWEWDEMRSRWTTLPLQAGELEVEAGIDRDPLRIGTDERAYLQLTLLHSVSGLDSDCRTRVFVRTFNDAQDNRYGDLNVGLANQCIAIDANANDTPDVLEDPDTGCTSDSECPGNGVCLNSGVCVIGFECNGDGDCASDESCQNNTCVRTSQAMCDSDNDCDGLVCDGGMCVACQDGTSATCGSGEVCAPSGVCVDADDPNPGTPTVTPDEVQGGACTCSVRSSAPGVGGTGLALLLAFGLLARRRRR